MNDDLPPWTRSDHLIADLWSLWAKQEHPGRAEMNAKARHAKKQVKVSRLKAKYQKLKRTYGLG